MSDYLGYELARQYTGIWPSGFFLFEFRVRICSDSRLPRTGESPCSPSPIPTYSPPTYSSLVTLDILPPDIRPYGEGLMVMLWRASFPEKLKAPPPRPFWSEGVRAGAANRTSETRRLPL